MAKRNSKTPTLASWQPLQLRATVFLSPTYTVPPQQTWWEDLVGEIPEKITNQPRTGETSIQGQLNEGILALTIQPLRIDWRYGISTQTLVMSDTFPTLGKFDEALNEFQSLMSKWFKGNPDLTLTRIAYGAELVQPVESGEKGTELLINSKRIPVDVDPKTTTDLLYQINRKRDADYLFPNLRVNRLSKWSVAKIERSIAQPEAPNLMQPQPTLYAVRLELDINTEQEFESEFTGEAISKTFLELIRLGNEIAEQGDIP